jgi:hypothetical protein
MKNKMDNIVTISCDVKCLNCENLGKCVRGE